VSAPVASPVAPAEGQPPLLSLPADFPALVAYLRDNGRALLSQQLHDFVGLVRYAPPDLAIRPMKPLPSDFTRDLAVALKQLTNANWQVMTEDGPAEPTLLEQERAEENAARDAILAQPVVKAAFEA